MPPMSAARLKTCSQPSTTLAQFSKTLRSTRINSSQKTSSCSYILLNHQTRANTIEIEVVNGQRMRCPLTTGIDISIKHTYRHMFITFPITCNNVMSFTLQTLRQVTARSMETFSQGFASNKIEHKYPVDLSRTLQ